MNTYSDEELLKLYEKHLRLFILMNKWTRLLQDGKSIINYFMSHDYKRIAIYGFGIVGETLEREIRKTDIEVSYIIDREAEYMYAPAKLIKPEEEFETVDVIVVTAIDKNGSLIESIRQRSGMNVVGIEEIIERA